MVEKERENPNNKKSLTEKYKVDQHTYPKDLIGVENPTGNYAVFYINVNQDSKMVTSGREEFFSDVENAEIQSSRKRQVAKNNLTRASVGATTTGLAAGAGAIVGSIFGGNLSSAGGTVGTALAVGTLGSELISNRTTTFSREQKRLKTAIALHVPNQLNVRYSVEYGTEDTAGFMAGNQIIKTLGTGIGGAVEQALSGEFSKAADTVLNGIRSLGDLGTAGALNFLPGGKIIGSATGIAPNPKKQEIFEGVNLRNFTIDYSFFPRSQDEMLNIQNIIKTFKYHMHPEYKDAEEWLFSYPSEFDIVYYVGSEENTHIHKHTSCVLTAMSVNYTPNGMFNSLANTGHPTQINISLEFRELQILTREDISEGY